MVVFYLLSFIVCLAVVSSERAICELDGSCSTKTGRLPLIAGNWKMNTDLTSAVSLATGIVDLTKAVDPTKVEVALFVPFPFIRDVGKVGTSGL